MDIPVDRSPPYAADASLTHEQQVERFNAYMDAHKERQALWRQKLDGIARDSGYPIRIPVGEYISGQALYFNWEAGDANPEYLVAEFQVPGVDRLTRNGYTPVVIRYATGQQWSKRKLLYPNAGHQGSGYYMASMDEFIYVKSHRK
jgi:hypothetical protein